MTKPELIKKLEAIVDDFAGKRRTDAEKPMTPWVMPSLPSLPGYIYERPRCALFRGWDTKKYVPFSRFVRLHMCKGNKE
jgi:hypothetical protein